MKATIKTIPYITAAAMLALAACSEQKESAESGAPGNGSALSALIVTDAPDNPGDIFETRKTAKPGDTITIRGKVMGRKHPFVPGRAIVVLGDPNIITSCDLRPGDSCTTPWDTCCDTPEDIRDSIVTVQVVDNDGSPVKADIKGVAGIKELSELVVTGVVADGSNKDNLLLNATAIYVKK